MNILLLTSVYPSKDDKNENVTKVVQYFAKEWTKQGHAVKVVHNIHRYPAAVHLLPKFLKNKIAAKVGFYIPDYEHIRKDEFIDDGVEVFKFPIMKYIPHGNHPTSVIKKQVYKIKTKLEDINFVPDVMIGHWASPQMQILHQLKDEFGCRTALILHGREYIDTKKFDFSYYLNKIDVLGCRSENEAEFIQKKLNLKEKPFICYSGIPNNFINNFQTETSKFDEKINLWKFIYVGRIVKYKNIDRVIRALAKIDNQNYVFDIIGEGAEEQNLKKLTSSLELTDKIIFHGRMTRENVIERMKAAHCFIMISTGEVFGLVYLEAMTSSCLTIATKNGGIDGVIKNDINGFLCSDTDEKELIELLNRMMITPINVLKQYTENAYLTANEYTDDVVAKKYLETVINF